ncbi:MAG: hypothetical protein WCI18_03245 [Pseudomonadota bacterium]
MNYLIAVASVFLILNSALTHAADQPPTKSGEKTGPSTQKKSASEKSKKAPQTPSTKSLMGEVYGVFSEILPLSVSIQKFSAKENSATIERGLKKLDKISDELVAHTKDIEFDYIGSNFKQDIKDMNTAWQAGRSREAQFIFRNLSTNCISCHTREAATNDSSQPKLFTKVNQKGLSTIELAELKTAIREFSEALDLYEQALSPKEFSMQSPVLMEGYIVDYMIVALKVKSDVARVIKTLDLLGFDPSVPFSLRMNIGKWIALLKDYRPEDINSVADTEKLISKGKTLSSFPLDSAGVVANILGAKHLQFILSHNKLSSSDQAEAYYLLGISELSINRPLQVSKANFFLEKAIHTAPDSLFAQNAYTSLESNIYYQNSGSLGVYVPSADLKKLSELKKLIKK